MAAASIRVPLAASLLAAAVMPMGAGAQGPDEDGWNDARTLRLVQRARDRRQAPRLDAELESYRADVSGHIYFFVDREANPEPILLRADQVALELYWAQPDQVKQVIQGMRSEEQFPIRDFRYYLDRYTVIQNGFDDVIRVGEGRDVRNVIHPLAQPGAYFYDFALADSTIIRLPGEPEPIRVYEVKVRPRDFDDPGIIGSLFLERARGDLVRLTFTFTPSSYIDPRNERVEVMLENGLWEGRYWLPRQQRLLVRRELPQFDIDVGTVIRAALTVDDYELNPELPAGFFQGRSITVAGGPDALASYDFSDGLFDGLDDVGLAPGTDPGTLDDVDVEAIAGEIVRQRFLRGISRVRLFVPTGSDLLRYDRVQGLVTGAGVSVGVGQKEVYAYGAYAWGSRDPVLEVGWQPAGRPRRLAWFGRAYLNRPRDLGLRPAAAGAVSTLSALALEKDLRDVAITSGTQVGFTLGDARTGRLTVSASAERRAASSFAFDLLDGDVAFRWPPILEELDRAGLAVEYDRRATVGPFAVRISPRVEGGYVGTTRSTSHLMLLDLASSAPVDHERVEGAFARLTLDGNATWTDARRRGGVELRATAGANLGSTPYHHLWYLGGRNTLPGHDFHEYVGKAAALADITAWRTVIPRWLRLRAIAAAGWADFDDGVITGIEPWVPGPTDGVASSVGVGIGLVDGLLRLDYGWRTDTWDGALILSIEPSLWPFL